MLTGLTSPVHLIILLVIVVLLFGANRIPELAKGIKTSIREFNKNAAGENEEDKVNEREKEEELAGSEATHDETEHAKKSEQ